MMILMMVMMVIIVIMMILIGMDRNDIDDYNINNE